MTEGSLLGRPEWRVDRATSEKDDYHGWLAIGRDWLMIALAIGAAVAWRHPLVIIAAMLLIGSQQYALAEVLLHEASHFNLFRSRRLHRLAEPAICWLFFRSIAGYRTWHLRHHRFFNTPRDPLYPVYQRLAHDFTVRRAFFVWWVFPLCGVASARLIRDEFKEGRRQDIIRSAILYVVLAVVAWQTRTLVWILVLWILPMILVFPAFYHWQEIEDHFACVGEGRVTVGRIRAFFHHNSGYHQVHHAAPAVPFYRLPSLFRTYPMPKEDVSTGLLCTYRQICAWAKTRSPDTPPVGVRALEFHVER